jgi:hypothetical protein
MREIVEGARADLIRGQDAEGAEPHDG